MGNRKHDMAAAKPEKSEKRRKVTRKTNPEKKNHSLTAAKTKRAGQGTGQSKAAMKQIGRIEGRGGIHHGTNGTKWGSVVVPLFPLFLEGNPSANLMFQVFFLVLSTLVVSQPQTPTSLFGIRFCLITHAGVSHHAHGFPLPLLSPLAAVSCALQEQGL